MNFVSVFVTIELSLFLFNRQHNMQADFEVRVMCHAITPSSPRSCVVISTHQLVSHCYVAK